MLKSTGRNQGFVIRLLCAGVWLLLSLPLLAPLLVGTLITGAIHRVWLWKESRRHDTA